MIKEGSVVSSYHCLRVEAVLIKRHWFDTGLMLSNALDCGIKQGWTSYLHVGAADVHFLPQLCPPYNVTVPWLHLLPCGVWVLVS